VRDDDDSIRGTAEVIVRAHDNDPAFRAIAAAAAPRIHAVLERHRQRRNIQRILAAVSCTTLAFAVAVALRYCAP
jgi:hypothetical protein